MGNVSQVTALITMKPLDLYEKRDTTYIIATQTVQANNKHQNIHKFVKRFVSAMKRFLKMTSRIFKIIE